MASRVGVFCLEGDWEDDLRSRSSVEPYLRLLEEFGFRRLIHRDVATVEEFDHYLARWLTRKYLDYRVAYFAFHGARGSLCLGKEDLDLEQLAEMLDGRAEGRILYFGSCQTLDVSGDELRDFCARTRAQAIAGYTRTVDWLQSAAFDFLVLPKLLEAVKIKPVFNALERQHEGFVHTLGFRMATAAWATSQRPAAQVGG